MLGFVVYIIWGALLHYTLTTRKEMEPSAILERQLEHIDKKINEQRGDLLEIIKKLNGKTTLESVAAVYNKQVLTAGQDSSITFKSQIINGIGNEPKLIGASFNKANKNKVSEPVTGKTGVYVFKLNSIVSKPANKPEETAQFRIQQTNTLRSQVAVNWFEGLRKKATIKDNRSKFY